jgi:hypothetical protein
MLRGALFVFIATFVSEGAIAQTGTDHSSSVGPASSGCPPTLLELSRLISRLKLTSEDSNSRSYSGSLSIAGHSSSQVTIEKVWPITLVLNLPRTYSRTLQRGFAQACQPEADGCAIGNLRQLSPGTLFRASYWSLGGGRFRLRCGYNAYPDDLDP